MKRPLLFAGIILAAATWLSLLVSPRHALLLSACCASTGVLAHLLRKRRLQTLCLGCLVAALGLGWGCLFQVKNIQPFQQAAGETVEIRGLVTEASLRGRAVVYVVDAAFPGRPDLPRARISIRGYGELEFLPGEELGCWVVLGDPAESGSPDYYRSREIYALGAVEGDPWRVEGDGFVFRKGIMARREELRRNLERQLSSRSSGIVAAMVLGERGYVDEEVQHHLNRSGVSHLLAVSGLHLSVVAGLMLALAGGLRCSRRTGSLLALATVVGFALLVGLSPSILRAGIMSSVALVARLLPGKRRDSLSSLGLALLVVSLARPSWLLGQGLWLSFSATLGILLLGTRWAEQLYERYRRENKIGDRLVRVFSAAGAISVSAYLYTLPFLMLFYGQAALLAPLANLLVTPFVPVIIGGGIFCSLFPASPLPIRLVALCTEFCTRVTVRIAELFSGLPFAVLGLDRLWMLFWLALVLFSALIVWRYRGRELAVTALSLCLLAYGAGTMTAQAASRNVVELVTLSGCDTALLLRGGDAVILGTPTKYEINTLLRYLEFRGVRTVSAVVATDSGEQVDSGLIRLTERYRVDCVLGPDDAFTLGEMALSMRYTPIYSGGYATLTALDGVEITTLGQSGDLLVRVGTETLLKTTRDYAIIDRYATHTIAIAPDGYLKLPAGTGIQPEPVGGRLFGERRVRISVD